MAFPIPHFERAALAPDWPTDAEAVAAVLITEDGRFLLQLRDPKPWIVLPDHWAFFAGSIEPGETPDQALRREMQEELDLEVVEAHWLFEALYALPRPSIRTVRKTWYGVPLALAAVPSLTLQEGADMALFTLDEMLRLEKLAPWDAAVAMILSRHATVFP